MTNIYPLAHESSPGTSLAGSSLNFAATIWFTIAVIGQWIFVYYVASFYGVSAFQGNLEKWNEVLPHGHVPGEPIGNLAVAIHLFLAVVIIVGGPLQIIPQIRNYARIFHRWNGRLYIFTAFVISISGLFMIFTRGNIGGPIHYVSISINAVLIMTFATLALRTAMAKKFDVHRRWVLRLFLVVNGVWFFRIGLMFWIFINKGPVGFDPETFTGPFLTFLGFAQYIIPLTVLELYFQAQEKGTSFTKYIMAGGLLVLTLVMGLGIFAATMGMWLPRI